jgi:hypothetical protein
MRRWEYKVFASHLDPAELASLLNESGREGWELITSVAVTDQLPSALIDTEVPPAANTDNPSEVVPVQAFRYIFKRLVDDL